jgi:hypothetical protein
MFVAGMFASGLISDALSTFARKTASHPAASGLNPRSPNAPASSSFTAALLQQMAASAPNPAAPQLTPTAPASPVSGSNLNPQTLPGNGATTPIAALSSSDLQSAALANAWQAYRAQQLQPAGSQANNLSMAF